MLILRSFKRKKSTKIYIIIISLLLVISSILILSRNYFNSYINNIYRYAHIVVNSKTNIKHDIEKIKDVKKVYDGIVVDMDTWDPILIKDKTVIDNELFYPYYTQNIKEEKIKFKDNEYIFVPIKKDNVYYRISNYMYDKIKNENNIEDYIYVIELKNWLNNEKIEKELYKNNNVLNVLINNYCSKSINFDVTVVILLFNVVSIFLIVLFIIILIITITNIKEDENNNKHLLRCLGYNKKKIILISSIKITYLFIISAVINFVTVSLILFILNLFFIKINFIYYLYNIAVSLIILLIVLILAFGRLILYYNFSFIRHKKS